MELKKRKYKRAEVEEILDEVSAKNQGLLGEYKDELENLKAENRILSERLDEYKRKDALINQAIISAEKKSADIIRRAETKYALEVQSLKTFCERYERYFSYLEEKYPSYGTVSEASLIFRKIADAVNENKDDKKTIEKADKILKTSKQTGKPPFDPKAKINDYIAATGDNGFNLDEVLNPGELHLEDLCKELGLLDEQ